MSNTKYLNQLDAIRYKNKAPYTFLSCARLQTLVAPFAPKNFSVVGGSTGIGLTSFIDGNIVKNLMLLESQDFVNPIAIHYFTLGRTELDAVLRLASQYITYKFKIALSPSDIRCDKNKSKDIYNVPTGLTEAQTLKYEENIEFCKNCIEIAIDWVSEMIASGHLVIHSGNYSPSQILNEMNRCYSEYGELDTDSNKYTPIEEYHNLLVQVVIDGLVNLQPDSLGHGLVVDRELHVLMNDSIKKMRMVYGTAVLISIPTDIKWARSYKDTEPVCKHLGIYGISCDTGLIIYDPVTEKHKGLLPKEASDSDDLLSDTDKGGIKAYSDSKGNNYLRYWFLVRNTTGPSNAKQKVVFYPGIGIYKEVPDNIEFNVVEDIKKFLITK